MNFEIERKFLLQSDGWRDEAVSAERLRDGLISEFGGGKVRVRLAESYASLTVKSTVSALARREFEYRIPKPDAELMLKTLCGDMVVEKTRHRVVHAGVEWSVDIYEKRLAGIAIAEVELDREDQLLSLPPWVGREVTGDARFHKLTMMRMSLTAPAPLTEEQLCRLPVGAEP
jgi:CYTH domain-containing protein